MSLSRWNRRSLPSLYSKGSGGDRLYWGQISPGLAALNGIKGIKPSEVRIELTLSQTALSNHATHQLGSIYFSVLLEFFDGHDTPLAFCVAFPLGMASTCFLGREIQFRQDTFDLNAFKRRISSAH
jgi:hypothetical protein